MDCVFTAFRDHLAWLGKKVEWPDEEYYRALKLLTHGRLDVYTDGYLVPFLVARLARNHGLRMNAEHIFYTPDFWLGTKEVRNHPARRAIVNLGRPHFGREVDRIMLAPGMMMSLSQRHAYFGYPNRGDDVVLAIALR